tara:strand:- start:530 stop:904 length:375 start_codon:yes stop_codon:yes gene_type:complete
MNDKDLGGRPEIVFTNEQVTELKALSAVLSKRQLADYFCISETTLRAIESRQPEVSDAYKKGKARAIASVAGNLITQAKAGNTAASIFYLKTQAGWKETTGLDLSSSDGSMTPPRNINDFYKED